MVRDGPSIAGAAGTEGARADFAVVIPLYNKGPFIARALTSVQEQRYRPQEVIVVDDGSTDDGADLVAAEFPTAKLVRQANAGVGAARNTGLSAACSEWIALLDADDVWSSEHLAELARLVERFPDADLLSTAWMRVREGEPWPGWPADPAAERRRIDYFQESALRGGMICASTAAVNQRAYNQLGGFVDAALGEDQEYWARIALQGPVAVSSLITAAYVRGVASVTEKAHEKRELEMVPTRARDALPVFATLEEARRTGDFSADPHSVHFYWNAKLERKAREALSKSHFARAQALTSFMTPPVSQQQRAIMLATKLPSPVLDAAMRIRARSRRRRSRTRGG